MLFLSALDKNKDTLTVITLRNTQLENITLRLYNIFMDFNY